MSQNVNNFEGCIPGSFSIRRHSFNIHFEYPILDTIAVLLMFAIQKCIHSSKGVKDRKLIIHVNQTIYKSTNSK